MTQLAELGLTPTQHAEIETLDPNLINAWLTELDKAGATVKNRAAWFVAAIKTGPPTSTIEPAKAQQIRLAETYIRNAGLYLPTEAELVDDLFGPHGKLRTSATDEPLKARMVALWQAQQPRAQQAEADATSRAEHWKAQRALAEQARQPDADLDQLFTQPET